MQSGAVKNIVTSQPFFMSFNSSLCTPIDSDILPSLHSPVNSDTSTDIMSNPSGYVQLSDYDQQAPENAEARVVLENAEASQIVTRNATVAPPITTNPIHLPTITTSGNDQHHFSSPVQSPVFPSNENHPTVRYGFKDSTTIPASRAELPRNNDLEHVSSSSINCHPM